MKPSVGYSSFALTLLRWYQDNGRALPWRATRDAYAIWLSEIILQQTRVQQGWEYWERFMRRWPTVEQLAAATEDEVLREWQGLGYYSRARNLHFAARQIVQMGAFPRTLQGIKSLKGVGDYTAAAIGSMAFDLPAAVVDGNVYRVLSRYFGISTPINSTEGKKEFALLAQELLPVSQAANYNQAIMDFGALQCTPQSPRCLLCPLQSTCSALLTGRIDQLPVKQKTVQVTERRMNYVYLRCQGYTAIRRRGAGDIWQGLWEPLLIDQDDLTYVNGHLQSSCQSSASSLLLDSMSSVLRFQLVRHNFRHVLTHRVLLCNFYLLETDRRPSLPEGYCWVSESSLADHALPRMIDLLVEQLNSNI